MAEALMPLTDHLEELRWRVLKAIGAVFAAGILCYAFSNQLFVFLSAPLLAINSGPENVVRLIGTGVVEAFFTKLKVSAIAGIFLASPILLYQIWQFVAPGLFTNEKRYARPFVAFGTFFFLAGAAFCYSIVLPTGYRFFVAQYGSIGVSPEIRISEYLSFTSRLLLAFGMTFELPVFTFFLARVGVVTHKTMIHYFRYAVLLIFILAAVLTPGPDVASQLLMATPLLILYTFSIGIAYLFGRSDDLDFESDPDPYDDE